MTVNTTEKLLTPRQAEEKDNHAQEQAKAQLESIVEMMKAWDTAIKEEDNDKQDAAQQAIQEDPLCIEVRGGWHTPDNPEQGGEAEEYKILLCTGGPAVQIMGELDQYNKPRTATLQYQDWFLPWTNYTCTSKERETLLAYANQFYFGE